MKDLKNRLVKWVKENKETFKIFAFLIGVLYFLLVGIVTNVFWIIALLK